MAVVGGVLKGRPAIFFDRDGVVNRLVCRDDGLFSPRTMNDFEVCEDIPGIFADLTSLGFHSIIVTNQPDIARGLMEPAELEQMSSELIRLGATAIYVCPHDDRDGCLCRKPLPGLITRAIEEFGLDVSRSVLVGDRPTDVTAAGQAGVLGCLVPARNSQTVISSPSDLRILLARLIAERTGFRLDR